MGKGSDYQDDIGYMLLDSSPKFNFNDFTRTYNYKKDSCITKKNCFKYKFIDLKDKTIKDCEIWSLFQQFQNQGFLFKRVRQPNPNKTFIIKLFQDNKKIEGNFTGDFPNLSYYTNTERSKFSLYVWWNWSKMVCNRSNFFFEATKAKIFNKNFDVAKFYYDYFSLEKKELDL